MRVLARVVLGTGALIAVLVAFGMFLSAWEPAHMHYPAPENESAFLRTYSLKRVVLPFVDPPGGISDHTGSAGVAGEDKVEHTADFGESFPMRSDRRVPLMQAVYNDLGQQLRTSGMQILSQSGDVSTGFKIRYRSGKSFGAVSISPLTPGKVQRNMPLPFGLEDVEVAVEIREKWFPKGLSSDMAQALP
ncbi:hypothetical protein [Occallatibacter savannae]|uniref:hypothetical protein n=1 Tax=Occallatibacter savannae TaxID=1002691 RepID=UPI0013A5A9E9|nr:hypothetical protein [Occallatibacter savannae]